MASVAFAGLQNSCTWTGHQMDEQELEELRPEIRERALDIAFCEGTADHLRDLAQTGVAVKWVDEFLRAAEAPSVLHWQVGEAFAEAMLERDFDVTFPWNSRRDERVPKASLPGADLVGLSRGPQGAVLVFGEVKSSADENRPPGVLVGKSGMVQQLERLLDDSKTQLRLIQWLLARIPTGAIGDQLNEALSSFVNSQGRTIRLIGVLVRDTAADEADVSDRGRHLGDKAVAPTSVELLVWYLPMSMTNWPGLVAA